MNANVLIVDDDPSLRMLLSHEIQRAGFTIAEADTVKTALIILEQQSIDVVLTDVHLPDGNGVELTRMIKTAYPLVEIIAITSQGKISDGVKAIQNGAFNYLEKGKDDDRLIPLLNHASEKALLQKRIAQLEKEVSDYTGAQNRTDIISQNHEQLEKATLIIKAIHSPLRQDIMRYIFSKGKATVKEIYLTLELPQPIASQHLALLKDAGLVTATRDGKSVLYSANYTGIEKIIAFVQQLIGN